MRRGNIQRRRRHGRKNLTLSVADTKLILTSTLNWAECDRLPGWELFKRSKDSTFLYLFKGRSINWVTLTVLSTCGQVIDIFTSRFRNSSRGQKPEFRLAYCIYSTVSMWETESKSAQWIGLMLCWSRTAAYTKKSLINGFFSFEDIKWTGLIIFSVRTQKQIIHVQNFWISTWDFLLIVVIFKTAVLILR